MLASNYRPLFSILRNGYPENTIHGEVFIASGDELLNDAESSDNLGRSFCPRSTLKPWQTKYLLQKIKTASAESYEHLLSSAYLPLFFASHSGQQMHEELWEQAASEFGITQAELECPSTYPRDKTRAMELRQGGAHTATDFHQCSGKHLLFVHACKCLGLDPSNYLELDHPIHKEMHALMQNWYDGSLKVLQDGCGLPNYVVTAKHFLSASRRLALAAKKEGTVEQALFNSWKENPRLVGGIRRLDSDITEETGGLFFAKEGADGLLWLQSLSDEPITILIKLGFGYKERYLAFGIFTELLRLRTRLKAKNAPIHPDLERLFGYLGLWVQNNLQKHQTLGLAEV